MTIETRPLAATSVTLTDEERALLLEMLEHASGEIRVEVHHTRTTAFKEQLRHREAVIQGLVRKLRPTTS